MTVSQRDFFIGKAWYTYQAKANINLQMNPVSYLKDTIAELKAVKWPSSQTTIRLTVTVIAISILVGSYVGGLDLAFTSLLKTVIK